MVFAVDAFFERYLATAEEYARLAEQAHDPTVAHEYQELARQFRDLPFRPSPMTRNLSGSEQRKALPANAAMDDGLLFRLPLTGSPAKTFEN
jgi:hypothetical protein